MRAPARVTSPWFAGGEDQGESDHVTWKDLICGTKVDDNNLREAAEDLSAVPR